MTSSRVCTIVLYMATPTSRLVVELKPDLHDAVTAYAHMVEATRKDIVTEALEEYLNKRSFQTDEQGGKAA